MVPGPRCCRGSSRTLHVFNCCPESYVVYFLLLLGPLQLLVLGLFLGGQALSGGIAQGEGRRGNPAKTPAYCAHGATKTLFCFFQNLQRKPFCQFHFFAQPMLQVLGSLGAVEGLPGPGYVSPLLAPWAPPADSHTTLSSTWLPLHSP